MEQSLFRYILKNSGKQQLFIVLLTGLSLPFYYLSLEMPKVIVNKALGAHIEVFPQGVSFFGHEIAQLNQMPLLLFYSFSFLFAVLVTGGLKYLLNVYKGLLGERLLRQLRRELCARMLRFPLAHFRKVSSAELNAMITGEVEPLGGFIGDAFALPLLQGGLLLTAMVFIFVQDPLLGVAAVALFPIQAYVIPKLRREVLELSRQRVHEVRRFSTRLGDAVAMAREIRTNAAGAYELGSLDRYLGRLLEIRYRLFRRKFFVKFLNNFLFQVTPFLFLLIGGYMVIELQLTIGALVAVLAAYKDLPPPAKELLDYYQEQQDAHIKYEQVVAQFAPPGMYPAEFVTQADNAGNDVLDGDIVVQDLTVTEEGINVLDGVSFTIRRDKHVAVIGADDRAGEALTQVLARLRKADRGAVFVGTQRLESLSNALLGRSVGYVGANPGFLSGTVEQNLFYGRDAGDGDLAEALAMLQLVNMDKDLYQLGLRTIIDLERRPGLAPRLLAARHALGKRLAVAEMRDFFEPFDRQTYCAHASIAENLLFGEPLSELFLDNRLVDNRYVRYVIRRSGLLTELLRVGCSVVTAVLDVHATAGVVAQRDGGRPLIHADELPLVRAIPERVSRVGFSSLLKTEQRLVLSIALRVVASHHGFCAIGEELKARIVKARRRFIRRLPHAFRNHIAVLDPEVYNPALTVMDNLLFGRMAEERPKALRTIGAVVDQVVAEHALHETIAESGLQYHVGVNGTRLSSAQRQQLAIARALLRRPQVLIACRATNRLDSTTERQVIKNICQQLRGQCMVWVLDKPSLAEIFDRVLVFENNRLARDDRHAEVFARVEKAGSAAASD
jgi:putative ABC transport system ATP-binding protein